MPGLLFNSKINIYSSLEVLWPRCLYISKQAFQVLKYTKTSQGTRQPRKGRTTHRITESVLVITGCGPMLTWANKQPRRGEDAKSLA